MWYLVCIIIKKYFLCSEVWWPLQWPSRLLLLQGRRSNSPGCLGCTGPPWPRIIVVIVIVIIIVDMVPQTWSQTNSITIVKHNHFQTPPLLPKPVLHPCASNDVRDGAILLNTVGDYLGGRNESQQAHRRGECGDDDHGLEYDTCYTSLCTIFFCSLDADDD